MTADVDLHEPATASRRDKSAHRAHTWFRDRRVLCVTLVIGLSLLGALVGLLVGGGRVVAETRAVVGSQGLSAQSVPYYSTATIGLAETYARYVTEDAGQDLPDSVVVSASVVPETPVIRIQAAASTEEVALAAAQDVTDELTSLVNDGPVGRTQTLATSIAEVNGRLLALREESDDLGEGGSTDEVTRVQTEIRLAELEMSALSTAYEEAFGSQVNPATGLTVIESAHLVDRTVPRPVLTGAVAGAVLAGLLTLGWFAMRRQPSAAAPE